MLFGKSQRFWLPQTLYCRLANLFPELYYGDTGNNNFSSILMIETFEYQDNFNGLVQERRHSIANALELRLSCTDPSDFLFIIIIDRLVKNQCWFQTWWWLGTKYKAWQHLQKSCLLILYRYGLQSQTGLRCSANIFREIYYYSS